MMLTTEEQLRDYVASLRKKKISKVALDMEGDQGMFRYNPAVSIFQCYDGENAVIIDVLKMGMNAALRDFLTADDIIKVMFACGNDVFMAQNVLNCTIKPIRDIAIAQKILNLPVNLTEHLNIDKKQKDAFQRANWLARPIKQKLLDYAVGDVLHLLDIEEKLSRELIERGCFDEYKNAADGISEKDFCANRHELYETKFPGYIKLSFEKKKAAAAVWIFRELLGEKLDCPVGYLLPRRSLMAVINGGELAASLERELNRQRGEHKKLPMALIKKYLSAARASPYMPKKIIGRDPPVRRGERR